MVIPEAALATVGAFVTAIGAFVGTGDGTGVGTGVGLGVVGDMLGLLEVETDGIPDGTEDGAAVGPVEGVTDGPLEATTLGSIEGLKVGDAVPITGARVGRDEGTAVGLLLGDKVGMPEGVELGASLGTGTGAVEGCSEGIAVGPTKRGEGIEERVGEFDGAVVGGAVGDELGAWVVTSATRRATIFPLEPLLKESTTYTRPPSLLIAKSPKTSFQKVKAVHP